MAIFGLPVVTVVGVKPTLVALSAETASLSERSLAGLLAAAKIVQAKARENMHQHHLDGRAERETKVSVHVRSVNFVQVTVGIQRGAFVPEGKTFEVGWRSARGLQPPVAPLAEWALRRGKASTEKEAQRVGYAIARAIGRRGYSFGEFHWLSDAWRDTEPLVLATVARYAISSWASQPRAAGGRWVPFS